jgi:hypothetical protein
MVIGLTRHAVQHLLLELVPPLSEDLLQSQHRLQSSTLPKFKDLIVIFLFYRVLPVIVHPPPKYPSDLSHFKKTPIQHSITMGKELS